MGEMASFSRFFSFCSLLALLGFCKCALPKLIVKIVSVERGCTMTKKFFITKSGELRFPKIKTGMVYFRVFRKKKLRASRKFNKKRSLESSRAMLPNFLSFFEHRSFNGSVPSHKETNLKIQIPALFSNPLRIVCSDYSESILSELENFKFNFSFCRNRKTFTIATVPRTRPCPTVGPYFLFQQSALAPFTKIQDPTVFYQHGAVFATALHRTFF